MSSLKSQATKPQRPPPRSTTPLPQAETPLPQAETPLLEEMPEEDERVDPPPIASGPSETEEPSTLPSEPDVPCQESVLSQPAKPRKSLAPLPPPPPNRAVAMQRGNATPTPIATDPVAVSARNPLRAVLHGVPPWSVSLVLHLAGLLLLAYWTLLASQEQEPNVLIASTVEETTLEIQDLAEFEIEKLEEVELENVSLEVQIPDPGPIEFANFATSQFEADLAVPAVSDVATREIGALFGDHGKGMSTIGEEMRAASFFGAKAQGSRFVFVVDNSNSMGGGRFETALDEIMRTVDGMSPQQQFYVVFFSDTAYPLFHPSPARTMVRATDENKQKLRGWLGSVEMCLKTKGEEALKTAFALQPDVIYILGDGRFTDRAGVMLVEPHNRRVPIHTLGMEVDAIGKREFEAIAKANHGTYRNVSASRAAQTMARKNPIKKNSRRGYVWGITLPDVDMMRKRKP